MSNRRNFLKSGSLVLASAIFGNHLLTASESDKKKKKAIGLQLYSLKDAMKTDVLGTLKQVGDIGFTTLESANYADRKIYGLAPAEFKKTIDNLGMKFTSAHLAGPNYTKETAKEAMEWWKFAIEDHAAAGAKFLVKPSMPIPKKLDELKIWCDYYNAVGELTNASDIRFGFHNHAKEFVDIEGEIMYDYMLKHTDPKKVFFEMDVYWLKKGGYNPVDYMTKYPDRFPVLHIKDEKELGASGEIDFKPIYKAAYKNGLEDSFVEVERYDFEPIESVRKSYQFLNDASYVK
jgi:sugar phosphate isomerase/epimerase